MRYIIVPIMFFCLFTFANAQVVINEIAWMGSDNGGTSSANSNDEWIELWNMGNEAAVLSGWVLKSTDDKPSIILDGTIEPQGYFLLERTDDASVPDIVANFIYVGALGNTGETLVLSDNSGVEIDKVVGGEDWSNIGGNNETKETAQRVSNGWITASPTPGSANSGSGGGEESEQQQEESSQSQSSSSSSSSVTSQGSSFPIEPQIFADAGGDRNVIVGADSLFEGKALGLQKKPLEGARYIWNFGNGETKEGQNVLHYYKYPGEYVVVLNVSSGKYSASDRVTVSAYPAELIISKIDVEFVELYNKSNRELNLSWWQIRSGSERFIIPKDTIILPNKKLIFSSDVTGLDTSVKENVSLLYPNGVEAFSFFQIKIPQKVVAVKTSVAPPRPSQPTIAKANPDLETESPSQEKDITQTASVISGLGNQDKDSGMFKWLLAIFSIVVVSAGAVIFMGKGKKEPGDDIEIVE